LTPDASRLTQPDAVANTDPAGADDFGEDALALVHHSRAQALANGIHLGAGVAGRKQTQDGLADFNLAAQQGNEVDTGSLDVGPDCARGDGKQAEAGSVFDDLFPPDQGHLPAAGLAGVAAQPAEVSRVAGYSFAFNDFNGLNGLQGLPRLGRMQVQRGDMTERGRGVCGVHRSEILACQSGTAGNPRQHAGTDLLALMEAKHEIRPTRPSQNPM
jgi:hypothetical protein